jgi:hypothetical protein
LALSELALRHAVPGQQIGGEWRFWKRALIDWLRSAVSEEVLARPGSKQAVLRHFGVFRDEPGIEEMLADIYARRKAGSTEGRVNWNAY